MPRHGIFIKDKSLFQHLLDYFVILTLARFTPHVHFLERYAKVEKLRSIVLYIGPMHKYELKTFEGVSDEILWLEECINVSFQKSFILNDS